VQFWVGREAAKTLGGMGPASAEDLIRDAPRLAEAFGVEMTRHGLSKVTYANRSSIAALAEETVWDKFLTDSSAAGDLLMAVRRAAPITKSGDVHSMVHKSIQEYFVAKSMLDAVERCGSATRLKPFELLAMLARRPAEQPTGITAWLNKLLKDSSASQPPSAAELHAVEEFALSCQREGLSKKEDLRGLSEQSLLEVLKELGLAPIRLRLVAHRDLRAAAGGEASEREVEATADEKHQVVAVGRLVQALLHSSLNTVALEPALAAPEEAVVDFAIDRLLSDVSLSEMFRVVAELVAHGTEHASKLALAGQNVWGLCFLPVSRRNGYCLGHVAAEAGHIELLRAWADVAIRGGAKLRTWLAEKSVNFADERIKFSEGFMEQLLLRLLCPPDLRPSWPLLRGWHICLTNSYVTAVRMFEKFGASGMLSCEFSRRVVDACRYISDADGIDNNNEKGGREADQVLLPPLLDKRGVQTWWCNHVTRLRTDAYNSLLPGKDSPLKRAVKFKANGRTGRITDDSRDGPIVKDGEVFVEWDDEKEGRLESTFGVVECIDEGMLSVRLQAIAAFDITPGHEAGQLLEGLNCQRAESPGAWDSKTTSEVSLKERAAAEPEPEEEAPDSGDSNFEEKFEEWYTRRMVRLKKEFAAYDWEDEGIDVGDTVYVVGDRIRWAPTAKLNVRHLEFPIPALAFDADKSNGEPHPDFQKAASSAGLEAAWARLPAAKQAAAKKRIGARAVATIVTKVHQLCAVAEWEKIDTEIAGVSDAGPEEWQTIDRGFESYDEIADTGPDVVMATGKARLELEAAAAFSAALDSDDTALRGAALLAWRWFGADADDADMAGQRADVLLHATAAAESSGAPTDHGVVDLADARGASPMVAAARAGEAAAGRLLGVYGAYAIGLVRSM
jgi:hypothetical protein